MIPFRLASSGLKTLCFPCPLLHPELLSEAWVTLPPARGPAWPLFKFCSSWAQHGAWGWGGCRSHSAGASGSCRLRLWSRRGPVRVWEAPSIVAQRRALASRRRGFACAPPSRGLEVVTEETARCTWLAQRTPETDGLGSNPSSVVSQASYFTLAPQFPHH